MSTKQEKMEAFGQLLDILDELRVKCPWDRKQTNESLRTNTIEETYELCDAIMKDDNNNIKKELGDLLLHIVFYAKIGEEKEAFDIKDVCDSLCQKLIFRHPHVFGDASADTAQKVEQSWEQIKLKEKGGNKTVLEGVPASLPSVVKAHRIQDKARNVGFDWEQRDQVWDKVHEEFTELKAEIDKMDADKIANQVLINMRARVKAENTRKTLKTSLQSKMDMTNRIQKFVDCRSKDVNEREVFIVEGDSALGACKQARDASFQAIMPVRGKILNCLKSDYDKIFKSEIITDLIKVLGCGVEVKSKAAKDLSLFDMDNLRWSKILICTDADVDGFHIRTLILTMIYRLMPKIIEAGKVYIAESPLYEVTCKDQTYFAYNEKEMDEIKAEIGDQKYTVQRSKGLGENEAEMMALTTMNPKTRRLIKVTPDDAQKTSEMFDLLLGDNLDGRKEYISDYGHLYLDAADVS